MQTIFDYDPISWYEDEPERQQKVAKEHIMSRATDGVSYWDLCNLNSYFISVFLTVARNLLAQDDGNLDKVVKKNLETIHNFGMTVDSLDEESDAIFIREMDINSYIADIDKAQELIVSSIAKVFIFKVLPHLPMDANWVREEHPRHSAPIHESEYAVIGSAMVDRLMTGLNMFADYQEDETSKTRSHPPRYTIESWVAQVRGMAGLVGRVVAGEEIPEVTQNQFLEDFAHLWI